MVVLKFSEAKDLKDLRKDRLDQEKNTTMSKRWSNCKRGLVDAGAQLCFTLVITAIGLSLLVYMMRNLDPQEWRSNVLRNMNMLRF